MDRETSSEVAERTERCSGHEGGHQPVTLDVVAARMGQASYGQWVSRGEELGRKELVNYDQIEESLDEVVGRGHASVGCQLDREVRGQERDDLAVENLDGA